MFNASSARKPFQLEKTIKFHRGLVAKHEVLAEYRGSTMKIRGNTMKIRGKYEEMRGNARKCKEIRGKYEREASQPSQERPLEASRTHAKQNDAFLEGKI